MVNNLKIEKDKCCGCEACVNICPKNCISMQADEEGFLYPIINKKNCISCNLCEKVCPFKKNLQKNKEPIIFAAKSNDTLRYQSSSGGIFPELARIIFKNEGVVFGAVMSSDNRKVIYKFASSIEELLPIQGSKYIQAEIRDTYSIIKKLLLQGKKVLFTGTTCQVAGLKTYLNKDYDNLICADVICHGVPSPLMWNKYCDYLENKYYHGIDSVSFRSKKYSWNEFGIQLDVGKKVFEFSFQNPYFRLFNSNLCLRPSCYACQVKGLKNLSDISLGDFWHIERLVPSFKDKKGISIVLVNTQKGLDIFKECILNGKTEIILENITYEQACMCNNAIYKSMTKSIRRDEFFSELIVKNFLEIKNKYSPDSWKYSLKSFLIKIKIWKIFQKFRKEIN